jgi:hypothetical protein
MPVTYAGFHLKPVGFFDGNPALYLPRSQACHTEGTPSTATDGDVSAQTGRYSRVTLGGFIPAARLNLPRAA